SYFVPPNFGHSLGYYIKVVPLDLNTNIKVNNTWYNGISRLSPLVINVMGDSGYYISSNKPVHVIQHLKGANCNGYITSQYGDPAMVEILSTKYFGNFAMFSTVNSNNLQDHFVSIVIPSSAKNKVYFDNTLLSPSEFKDFPYNGNFSYTSLFITDGRHVVQCSDGFLAYCYGIGSAESYFYIAGFNLPDFDLNIKDSVVNYDCKAGNIDVRFS